MSGRVRSRSNPDWPELSWINSALRTPHSALACAWEARMASEASPHAPGRFGPYGGRYVPETLMAALEELERVYDTARQDPSFWAELEGLLKDYVGRPTPLTEAPRLAAEVGQGVVIALKREDLNHTGAHKINNTLGQALLARRMRKRRIIAETGAGQHGVATATVCARFGLDCVVYMGEEDMRRQRLNVYRMELMGARAGRLPGAGGACVGGGSNAMGIFTAFLDDRDVALVGVEAAGEGVDTARHAASLGRGRPGVFHGSLSYLLQNADGQVQPAHSVSAGLDYPGVGPEHAYLKDSGRVLYEAVTDRQALEAFAALSRLEGILPALESAHAVAWVLGRRGRFRAGDLVVLNLSGRGDKDVAMVAELTGATL